MSGKKRIALYGGTFDPVHLGHVELARTVSQIFEIDELLFVPAWLAPHKRARQVTPAIHRYAMLVLATQDDDQLKVSRFELEAPDRKYTVETIEHFQAELGNDVELFFVMGADSWAEIKTWRDWERLLKMTNHIVVTRPGFEIERGGMSPAITKRIVDTRGSGFSSARETSGEGTRIFISDAITLGISATEIRKAAREGQFDRLANLAPEAVANYIMKYGLYRETNES
jgi:nicotinate-nucleotide adenylyltransferase